LPIEKGPKIRRPGKNVAKKVSQFAERANASQKGSQNSQNWQKRRQKGPGIRRTGKMSPKCAKNRRTGKNVAKMCQNSQNGQKRRQERCQSLQNGQKRRQKGPKIRRTGKNVAKKVSKLAERANASQLRVLKVLLLAYY
jgi:hypothetical protein